MTGKGIKSLVLVRIPGVKRVDVSVPVDLVAPLVELGLLLLPGLQLAAPLVAAGQPALVLAEGLREAADALAHVRLVLVGVKVPDGLQMTGPTHVTVAGTD